jgi:O-methyltransferase
MNISSLTQLTRKPTTPNLRGPVASGSDAVRRLASALRCRFGYNPRHYLAGTLQLWNPPDISEEHWSIVRTVRPYTLTSPERVCAVLDAVEFVVRNDIPGSIVECGVWKGGSMMAAALALLRLNAASRDLYLFDTFEGMPRPEEGDSDYKGRAASRFFHRLQTGANSSSWCAASPAEVQKTMDLTGYDRSRIHLVKGLVEETIPRQAPDSIALLRLDTDWYESTKHELEHLFPRLSKNGVLIIDDYGHWRGARKAVDEYFSDNGKSIFLSRVDYAGRVAIKLA